jgi:hypothetical protein
MPNAKIGFARVTDSVRGWRSERWLVLVIVVLGPAVLYSAFSYGQKMRAIAEDRLWRTIADEDRAFCEKFGMRADTPRFVTCGQELWIIRQRQADRDRAAAQGLL